MREQNDRLAATARALTNREPLEVSTMPISDLILALSATEDRLSEWRGIGSPPGLKDPSSDHRWVIAQRARIVRELRSRRRPSAVERRPAQASARVSARSTH